MDVKVPGYVKLVITLLVIVLSVIIMVEGKMVLVPLLIALLLAILISPLTTWLDRKGLPSLLSVFISVIALLAFLTGLGIFFYNQLLGFSGELNLLEDRVSELLVLINEFLSEHIEGSVPISLDNMQGAVFQYIYENMAMLTGGIIATATTLTLAFMVPVYIIFLLYFRNFLMEFILQAFGKDNRRKTSKIASNVKNVVQNYIVGMFFVICILFVLSSIALYSLGIEHALLFASFASILNIIPFIGPFIGAVFPILYALLSTDSLWYPVGVFLSFYIIQLLESNLFTPKIVGGKVSMNPLMTILALFIGNHIWGLAGMILFIPGMAILKVVFDEIEGMQPYAFLLGDIRKTKKQHKGAAIDKKIKKAKRKLQL
ncbi:MAG: AI-2E family transporter [Bacteroidales bacterium]